MYNGQPGGAVQGVQGLRVAAGRHWTRVGDAVNAIVREVFEILHRTAAMRAQLMAILSDGDLATRLCSPPSRTKRSKVARSIAGGRCP